IVGVVGFLLVRSCTYRLRHTDFRSVVLPGIFVDIPFGDHSDTGFSWFGNLKETSHSRIFLFG
ncbi:hypothetical protein, partial [Maribacter sp. 2-571]|uniref:hypothetical protein n=1 Tax=Maribacter sp. 2-571 TaxID=3417569 RepID=UPI003D334483